MLNDLYGTQSYDYQNDKNDSTKMCGECLDWDPIGNDELECVLPPKDYPSTKFIVNGIL
jgi:hypothetical protein